MTSLQPDRSTPRKPLRLWPGVAIVLLQLVVWIGLPMVSPDAGGIAILAGVAGGFLVILWWLLFSRAPWVERLGAIVVMVVAVYAMSRVVHKSIAGGMMGMMPYILAIPMLGLALVAWAAATRRLPSGPRRAWMVVAILLGCGVFTLIRTEGLDGDARSDFRWRWSKSPEERLLAQAGAGRAANAAADDAVESGADWPGFRGPNRDGVVSGVRIETNWSSSPPAELWRREVGPGWSSFAVRGNMVYTQEQRGDEEVVASYNATTGEPVWQHSDAARFWESNAGAGPRATPTLSNGRVYTCGATGVVNALDARDGSVVWSRNAASDTEKKVPGWGFASSPLVVDDIVIVATSGRLAGYDLATGEPRWTVKGEGWGYSSPHLVTIDGVKQVLLLNGAGAISIAPADGTRLWDYPWPGDGIVQPAFTEDGDLLIGTGSGMGSGAGIGVRRVHVARNPGGWDVKELWTSNGLKPYFNDFVVHKGHAYGFDGNLLACIDLADGKRAWKGGRYGHGQMILLPDQDLLVVLSEQGDLALVAAASDQHRELARVPAIKGKTWNHPVLAGNVLLVRNDQEMAAFRLSPAGQ